MKDNFIEELRELCKKYDVSLYGGYDEDVIILDGYTEECVRDMIDARNKFDTTGKIV